MPRFLFALIAVLVASPVAAQEMLSPLIGSFEAGVVCSPDVAGTREAPGTVAGETHVIEALPPFVSHGRLVPAVLGVGFAVRVATKDPMGVSGVEMRVTHPPMTDAGITEQSFPGHVGGTGDPGYTSYTFDFDYELLPGDWSISAHVGDVQLYRVDYRVVSPDLLPELAAACGYTDLIG